ncbi:chromatin modification- protein VID21 [Coemansia sp. RSA 2050]|nr:chromatin modification- protein VID21 [Coemansia sp. RSA 2050]
MGASEEFQQFLAHYASESAAALVSAKLSGQESWRTESSRASVLASEPSSVSSDQMEVDSETMFTRQAQPDVVYETDSGALIHPDDIVFLSQLEPVPIAEVLTKCAVKSAELPALSMACHSYQEQIDDINARSSNMHSWMLRAQEQPLYEVVSNTNKLVSTKDWDTVRDELIRVRVMERIEELKEKGKWSFWQPRKHRAPPRGKVHWDYLLEEMTWMHADFAEERKLRVEMARLIASWVMDYHHAIDKSHYVVAARRYVLPDDFICRDPPQHVVENPLEVTIDSKEAVYADPDKVPFSRARSVSRSSSSHISEANQQLLDGLGGHGASADAEVDDLAAVPSGDLARSGQATDSGEDADVSITGELAPAPLLNDDPASRLESTLVDKEADLPDAPGPIEGASKNLVAEKPVAKGSPATTYEDRVVPSDSGALESTLSIYQILAQIPQSECIEDILGDSVYALQSLNSLQPYRPTWDMAYCDILDASPVIPICKTMWPDFGFDDNGGSDDDPFVVADGLASTIDVHELFSLNGDESMGRFAVDSDLYSTRSIFTRNLLAPPLLPMFTQANKVPRNVHYTAGQPPADTPLQQAISEACPGQAVFEWSAERDKLLAKVVQQYTGNWALITETVNHALELYGSCALTARILFERWAMIKDDYSLDRNVVQTGFDEPEYGARKQPNWSSQLSVQPMAAPLSAMQLATRLVSHSEALRVISDSKAKREAAAKPSSVPPREIKPLPADQKVPTPAELTKLKFESDRRMQQMLIEQRQATAAATALALQQRAPNLHLQHMQFGRQIAALQAMLASGRGPQRPLTPEQVRILQLQIQNLQVAQLQNQHQVQAQIQAQAQSQMQAQNGSSVPRPPQILQQQAQALQQQQNMQIQLAHAAQQQAQLAAGQVSGGQQQQQLAAAIQGNGAAGMRFTPEQIQQILQARVANGVRPNITPALAAALNARAQMAGANVNNGQLQGAPRPINAAAAAASMLPPQQRQMFMQQIAQQQLAQQQQQNAMSPPSVQMQRPQTSMPGMQQAVAAMSMSPQIGSPPMQQQLQQPGSGASPAAAEASAPLRASPAAPSEQNTPLLQPSTQMPGGGMAVTGSPNVSMTQAQAQTIVAAQQAMQAKQMQIQQQLMLQQQSPAGVNQPQFAQYLSSLYPHQLAQISNQQRMNLLAMRQQQQHQTLPQQQQFQGQLGGQNLLNQQAALQALQQGLLGGNGVGGMNGLGGLNPALSQQMLAAQLAQNMKNQQMLKAGQPLSQALPQQQQQQQRPQTPANVNQMQLMRIRQAMQQQAMSGGPQRMFPIPGSQTASSPVMMSPPGPTSLPSSAPIPGSPAMSTPLPNGSVVGHNFQMSPPMQAQPTPLMAGQQQQQPGMLHGMSVPHQTSMSPTMPQQQAMMSPQMHAQPPRPPLGHLSAQGPGQRPVQPQGLGASPIPGMQPSQQAMMMAAATAAGLSSSAAQSLIAQIAANAELSQQQQPAMPSSSHMSPPPASGEPSVSPSHAQVRPVTGSATPGQGSISPGSNGGSMTPIGTPTAQTDPVSVPAQQRPLPAHVPLAQAKQQQPHVRPNRPVRPGVRPHMARPMPPGRGTAGATPPGVRPVPRPMALSPANQQQQRPVTPAGATQAQQRRPPPSVGGVTPTRSSATPVPATPMSGASTPTKASGGVLRAQQPPANSANTGSEQPTPPPKSAAYAGSVETPSAAAHSRQQESLAEDNGDEDEDDGGSPEPSKRSLGGSSEGDSPLSSGSESS